MGAEWKYAYWNMLLLRVVDLTLKIHSYTFHFLRNPTMFVGLTIKWLTRIMELVLKYEVLLHYPNIINFNKSVNYTQIQVGYNLHIH